MTLPVDATPSPAAAPVEARAEPHFTPAEHAAAKAMYELRPAYMSTARDAERWTWEKASPDSRTHHLENARAGLKAAALARAPAAGADHVLVPREPTEALAEALRNMVGAFDTPIRRRKYPTDIGDAACHEARDLLARLAAAPAAAPAGDVRAFAAAVLHGDDEHRAWLAEAAEAWCAGQALPAPRGKGAARPDPAPPAGLSEVERLVDAYGGSERWLRDMQLASRPDFQKALDARDKARSRLNDAVRAYLAPAAGVGALVDDLVCKAEQAAVASISDGEDSRISRDRDAARTALLSAIAAKDREIAALRDRVAQLTGEIVLPTAADRFRRYALSIAVHDWPSTQPAADVERRVEQIEWQITGMFCAEARPYLDRALKAEEEIAALRRDPGAGVPEEPAEELPSVRGLREALDFFDRVKVATEAEKIAVGSDHWNRLEAAARAVVETEGRPGRPGGEG